MAKKIDRARVEAGRVELPKKLGFLTADKVDFTSVTDKDGDWTVEMSVAALQKLVKSRNELKSLKADNKKAAAQQAGVVDAEKAAHEDTRQALAKAERRIKVLEKKLAGQAADAAVARVAPAPSTGKRAQAVQAPSTSSVGKAEVARGPVAADKAPKKARVPKKISAKKPTLPVEPAAEVAQAVAASVAS